MRLLETVTSRSPVQDNRLLHRVAQELLDIVPLQKGWRWQGLSGDLTMPVTNGWPRGCGPQTADGLTPTSFWGYIRWENKSSPCCKLCMFLSDHLRFLKRNTGWVGSWPRVPVTPVLGRIQTWPLCALGLEYKGKADGLFQSS